MALSLKVADLYADLKINMGLFNAQMAQIKSQLARLQTPTIRPTINTSQAMVGLNAILAKMHAIQRASVISVSAKGRWASSAASGASSSAGGQGSNFIPITSVQMAGIKFQDAQRAAAAAKIALDAKVQAAYQASMAKQVAMANRAYAQRTAAANRAAASQIAADARVQAAHQRSVAKQVADATRAYNAKVKAAQRAAKAMADAAITNRRQFGGGMAQGVGLPFLGSPQQAAGMAIGAGLKMGVETALDLETKFAEIRRVAGLSADETARLKSELMAISTVQPGATLDDLIKMADVGSKMGLKGQDLKEFASGLALVRNSVAGIETEDLANKMARVMNVFKLGPEYIRGFGSALNAMGNATTASEGDILKISEGLSGTAAAIGITLPQVTALAATLRDVGLSNAVASSSFSQIFRKMGTESAKFAQVAGVDAKAFADAYRKSPMEALSLLMTGLANAHDTIEKQELLKELGLDGVRASGAMLQLGQAIEKVAGRADQANAEFTSLKSLMDANAIKGDTAAASLGKLGNVMTAMADAGAAPLLVHIKAMADGLTEVASAAMKSEVALDRALQKRAPQGLDWMVNHFTMAGFVGKKTGMGNFNGFRRISNLLLGAPAPDRKMAVAAPALPKPAAVAVKPPPDPLGLAMMQGFASRLGLTVDRATDKGGLNVKARAGGGGLLNSGLPQLLGGLATGNLGKIAGGANQLSGGGLVGALKAAMGGMDGQPKAFGSASVGLSSAEFGRQQQLDALNNGKADQQIREAQTANRTLAEIRDQLNRAKNNAAAALLGP